MKYRLLLCLAAAAAIPACSSRPQRPGPDREIITLAEHVRRKGEAPRADRLPPVVVVPAGSRIQLRITPQPGPEEAVFQDLKPPFEQVEDIVVTIRANNDFQLDMKDLTCWVEGQWHGGLGFSPWMFRATRLSVTDAAGSTLEMNVEAQPFIFLHMPGPRTR